MIRRPPPRVLAAVVGVQVVSAAFAWRDLGARSQAHVRGPKKLWKLLIVANPGNSLAYWAFGRR